MNVAVYDTEHFETTYTLLMLLKSTKSKIILFVTEDIAANLRVMLKEEHSAGLTWIVLEKAAYSNAFTIYKHCKQNDIRFLYLGTVAYHHLAFSFLCLRLRRTRKLLTIHDANSFFRPVFEPSFRGIIKHIGKKLLPVFVNYYSTLLSTTKTYIEKEFHPSKEIFCIPGSFFEEIKMPVISDNPPMTIVIPGSVDIKRRNYKPLFETLDILHQQNCKLEILLLGSAKDAAGKEVIQKCKNFNTKNLKIKVYEEAFVDQIEYEYQLRRCDYIYAPLQRFFHEESSVSEIYGLTKSSGCFFDAIRFGKPILLPANVCLPDEIAPQTIVHKSADELALFISNLQKTQTNAHKAAAVNNAYRFTLRKIKAKVPLFNIEVLPNERRCP